MKVLLIDDDVFFQNFYATKLQESGFEVIVASNGQEGVSMAKQHIPDVILLDIIMPVKDGFVVLQELQADIQTKNIPVLIFSDLGQEEDVKKALSLGAKDFIGKTVLDFETLKNKILAYSQKPNV